ncbi:MAG: T9SS type A sorting domain-containing protein [Bacteroidota bacterium]
MKKQHPLKVSIPKPCHEHWEAMSEVDRGRFCHSCQRTVFDFTNLSDTGILNLLEEKQSQGERLCGRFRASQLDRKLRVFQATAHPLTNKAAGLLLASLLTGGTLDAQNAHQSSKVGIVTTEQPTIGQELIGEIEPHVLMGDIDVPLRCSIPPPTDILEPEKLDAISREEQAHFLTGLVAVEQSPSFWQRLGMQWRQWWSDAFRGAEAQSSLPDIPPEIPEVQKLDAPVRLEIFPNPFIHSVNLRLIDPEPGAYQLQLIDGNGRLLESRTLLIEPGEQLIQLDWSRLRLIDGMYFLRVQQPSGKQSMYSLVRSSGDAVRQP